VVRANSEVFALEVKSGSSPDPMRGLDAFCAQFPQTRPQVVGTGGITLETWFSAS
jgi:hypothetical protein